MEGIGGSDDPTLAHRRMHGALVLAPLCGCHQKRTSMSSQKIDWPSLADYPHLTGRPAEFSDVHAGRAVFVARVNGQLVGRPVPIPVPQYAFQVDQDTQQRTPCIVVQAEEANSRQIFGARRVPDGQELVGFSDDFELLGSSPPTGQ
jgi:hypothetical protein